jgi:DNA-binding transcriptional LysR family regulator
MIDSISDLLLFSRVAGNGSMTAAAREMDLSLAVVSKRIAGLEERLGVRLLNRTTRRQSLTHEGKQFHAHCMRILAVVRDAESELVESRSAVAGILRVTAPLAFGRHYAAGLLAAFHALHPDLQIELTLDDEMVDLVDTGIDAALRFGALDDSNLIARYIAPSYRVLCAAPAYIARRGAPAAPGDLKDHACIVYRARSTRHWLLNDAGETFTAPVPATFVCNDGDAAQALALEGAGIIYRSIWDVAPALESGALVRVLAEYSAPTEPLHVVYAHTLQLAPRVRHFADFAIEYLRARWRW